MFVPLVFIVQAIRCIRLFMTIKEGDIPKSSEPSDDSVQEMRNILDTIRCRDKMSGGSMLRPEDYKLLAELRISSELANMVRHAHFAGCNLIYEQDTENKPAYFKTDLKRAAAVRRSKKRNLYR